MRWFHRALLMAALAGCSDTGPITTAPQPPTTAALGSLARAPFEDAIERIVPTLGTGAAVEGLRVALTAAMKDGTTASLQAVNIALDQLIAAQPDAAADADAIRLATTHR